MAQLVEQPVQHSIVIQAGAQSQAGLPQCLSQLALLAFGLCMAPTCFLLSFVLATMIDADAMNQWHVLLLSMYFVLPVVFGAIGAIALSSMFSGSISGVADVLGQIGRSGGKLEGIRRVPVYFKNELGDVAERANVMVDTLSDARVRLDAAHQAAIRAEKLASVGQLAATIGHELRNPLAAVRNAHVYTMRRIAQAEMVKSDPRLGQMLDIASRELDSCSRLIGDLLDFARERPLMREPLPLASLVEEAITLVPARASITVKNDVAEDLPLVEIDREQFRRVLINLVQNAVEAYPDGASGTVRIGARHEGGWEMTIADDGPGISAEVAARIFEPLFTTKVKGTGLGLAVVRSVVERHGGTIDLASEVGKGTRFRIAWAAT